MSPGKFKFAAGLSVAMGCAAVVVSLAYDLPLRDPDSFAGPNYLRLPAILLLAYVTDVVPRTVRRARGWSKMGSAYLEVTRERWPWEHVRFVILGLGTWYLTYVAFRDLKSFVPFVNSRLWDRELAGLDRLLFLGQDPATLLHHLLGSGLAAHVMSAVYLVWIGFVPFSLAAALVWTRNRSGGAWYVTAVAVDWVLGVATYYAVPTVGPVYAQPQHFNALAQTHTTDLQATMIAERGHVLAGPFATDAVQTVAAFASLHVAILVTACLVAQFLDVPSIVQWVLQIFLALTVLATVYLGWHYFVDVLGGALLGVAAVWVAAIATGNHVRGRPLHVTETDTHGATTGRRYVGYRGDPQEVSEYGNPG